VVMKASAAMLNELGIRVEGKSDIKVYAPSAESLFSVYLKTQTPPQLSPDITDHVKGFHGEDYKGFSGISNKDIKTAINGSFDTKPFLKAQKLIENQFAKIIPDEVLTTPKRTRFMSEHDGELD